MNPSADIVKALQLLHSGVNPLEVIEQLKMQGLSPEKAKEVTRDALYEFRTKDLIKGGKSFFDLLKIGLPIMLIGSVVLSFFLSPLIAFPVGLIVGIIVMAKMTKKKAAQ